jgi:hypothetical protein
VKYPENTQLRKTTTPGLSENNIENLIEILNQKDGVIYVSATWLRFSRPAICLTGKSGEQRTITVDNAKQILKENGNG